jgi:hypothetical protein
MTSSHKGIENKQNYKLKLKELNRKKLKFNSQLPIRNKQFQMSEKGLEIKKFGKYKWKK